MADWNPEANALFLEARELAAGPERDAFLDQACRNDKALKARVIRLLSAGDAAGSFLSAPGDDAPVTALYAPTSERPRTVVGPYKLLQEIGEGGMGIVYMAEQTEPVRRTVAVKIIKPGMDTRQVVARFEAERQALALMDHPNIAKVFDAGATDTGRPYFVMELVKGLPITKYCDEQRLTLRDRLELFIPVCQAVQHAHQKGIIHRDLKPSNVMIALYDGQPVPKVIDFGVAKAAGQKLTERTMFTEFGAVVGTLEYMSPEQAELNQLDVDTRSDIYSLGVLLYELLTGTTPLDRNRLKKSALQEVLRIIREEEPPKPSTRISTIEQLPTVAAQRSLEPGQFSETVRGELDWIVMKALDKDRNRRYETANGFFRDIERYLADEPVQACPPSAAYRFRKFVKRNKAPAVAASLVISALLAGVAVSTWQAVRATRAEAQAVQERRAAELSARQGLEASAAERYAKEAEAAQRKQAEAVSAFLISAFRSPDPALDGRKITIAEVLDRAAKELNQKFDDDPRTDAALLQAISESYLGLGLYREAIPLLEKVRQLRSRALGADHLETVKAMHALTNAYCLAGRFEEARPLGQDVLEILSSKLGPDHPDTLAARDSLGSLLFAAGKPNEAAAIHKETFERMKATLGPDHATTLATMKNLAQDYLEAKQIDTAVELIKETIERSKATLGANHPLTLSAMHILGRHYLRAGKINEALPLCEEVLKQMQARLGLTHPSTLMAKANLGFQSFEAGRKDEALAMWEETYQLMLEKIGPEHPVVTQVRTNLANTYLESHQSDKAIPLLEENIKFRQVKFGPGDEMVKSNTHTLADSYRQLGRPDRAVALFVERFKRVSAKFGPDHPAALQVKFEIARANALAGRSKEAQALYEETLKAQVAKLGPIHEDTLATYRALGRYDEAIAACQEVLRTRQKELGLDHPDTLALIMELAYVYRSDRRYAEAEHYYRLCIDHIKDSEKLLEAQKELGECLLRQGNWDEGVEILQEILKAKLRRGKAPEANELSEAWAKLAESTVSPEGMPGQDGLDLDGDHDFVVVPSLQFDGRPPWSLEAIVRPVELDHRHNGWSALVSAVDGGSIGLETLNKKWTMDEWHCRIAFCAQVEIGMAECCS